MKPPGMEAGPGIPGPAFVVKESFHQKPHLKKRAKEVTGD